MAMLVAMPVAMPVAMLVTPSVRAIASVLAAAALSSAAACAPAGGVSHEGSADVAMAPSSGFANSYNVPGPDNAEAAGSDRNPAGPASSNYNGPDLPPDPPPAPGTGSLAIHLPAAGSR